jgi:hypothetical protein
MGEPKGPQAQNMSERGIILERFDPEERRIIENRTNSMGDLQKYLDLCSQSWSCDTILVCDEDLICSPLFFLDPNNKPLYEELINNPEHEAIEVSLFYALVLNHKNEILLVDYDKNFNPTPSGQKWDLVTEMLREERKGKFLEGIRDHFKKHFGLDTESLKDAEVEMFDRFLHHGIYSLMPEGGNKEYRYFIVKFGEDKKEVLEKLEGKEYVKEIKWLCFEELVEQLDEPSLSYNMRTAMRGYLYFQRRRLKNPIEIKF